MSLVGVGVCFTDLPVLTDLLMRLDDLYPIALVCSQRQQLHP